MKALNITAVVLAVIGGITSVFYLVKVASAGDLLGASGAIATMLSILLAYISIRYTQKTNDESQAVLQDIREQNSKLVDKINLELRKNNFNDSNIASIEKKLSEL